MVMSRAERTWRVLAEIKARNPYTCPACGSGALHRPLTTDRRQTTVCLDCGREFTSAD